ncbi:Eukaryotic translation initiation factor 4 gamma [Desmophyllum pertusum]|uniref:Eukaryotic translation initiation factor 4 gamma n=1 Tax=Desmophyllum pertusum TaxID=174260 RepID=A0A9W9YUB4_9CNID|nr:Eukaryotic translation initiation factor 4 gamma [Desmophyllum pertusum]
MEQESTNVPSCLPDELPVFGRLDEIQQITDAIQSGTVSLVWITGGPGFGKTTVANKAAHELAKPEYDRAVLFCSLRSKATLYDVATLMTLACSTNQMKPPENTQHWLLNWSKQQSIEGPLTKTSVEKSIKSSFEVLDELEQKALVLLCVFPGSFNSDAAKSLIADVGSTNAKSVLILLELKARSLVEQLSPCRYQVHQLIQTSVQRIASDKYPELLNRGKKLACAHFICRLADNADLYWGKNTCKQSVDSFNEDRHNFEHFLQILDQEIVGTCRIFLHDFPQKCMYLEKCVLPKFYIVILERLLQSFDSEMHPVHAVDVLCLLGHESRKEGDKKKYKELMEKAEQIHSKHSSEFETKALSEVYFRNSYARFLSHKKDPNENKRMEHETETALKVCNEYLGRDHPETAATLLFAGIHATRRKERSEAEQKLTEALELFKKLLGKHLMTAQCLKAIADHCFFFDGKTEADLDKCLAYYGDAMEVFEDLGMGDNKESVLTRKNFGMCHTRKDNFNEAMTLLTKADRVAEQELEADHSWKISIKIALAILHEKMRNPDQAKDVMLEGLLMGKRLHLSIAKMGNKDEIGEFINRYPETFPENKFPRNVRASTGSRRQNYGFSGLGRSRQESHKPMSGFGRRGHFQSSEREKALEVIPAETQAKNALNDSEREQTTLNVGKSFIKSYFDSFYDEELVTEETFNLWESSTEEERGKGLAVTASSEFFRWIRYAAEEPGED